MKVESSKSVAQPVLPAEEQSRAICLQEHQKLLTACTASTLRYVTAAVTQHTNASQEPLLITSPAALPAAPAPLTPSAAA
jgi:DNA-binding FadR family transcriptional regulator